jgi:hypothetical protein
MSIYNGSVRGEVTNTGYNPAPVDFLGNVSEDGRIEIRNRDIVLEGVLSAEMKFGEGVVNMLTNSCKGRFEVTRTY